MKVAVTSTGRTLESPMDPRFGRAEFFIVVDTETLAFEVRENHQNLNLPQGAGIQAGKAVADLGVEAVITGNLGPKAYTVLEAVGIRMVTGVSGTVRQAVQRFKAGELTEAGGPNVEGHWV